jgi:hypothetical protein
MTDKEKLQHAFDLLTSFLLENTDGGFEEISEVDEARTLIGEVIGE